MINTTVQTRAQSIMYALKKERCCLITDRTTAAITIHTKIATIGSMSVFMVNCF